MKRELTPEQLEQPITVTIPLRAVLRLADLDAPPRTPEFSPRAVPGDFLPKVGEVYEGGIYAGLTLHQGAAHALVLLPGEAEDINWKNALAWAEKQGGVLPSRIDQLVLFQNLPREFKEAWYWSGEEYARLGDYAWYQGFGYGGQSYGHKGYEGRCRAVRRVAL